MCKTSFVWISYKFLKQGHTDFRNSLKPQDRPGDLASIFHEISVVYNNYINKTKFTKIDRRLNQLIWGGKIV